eukprot:TRINITY_DN1108_c0_g2_i1.p1 TRINITY_DN1108_c0_g2~~TRINITY_DN1108_c0_g2_i1.p1  ORF type:complete len:467 (+),score=132.89 TRINITY_DN1108_c0_g2_i1:95-1495(+)
MKQRRIELLIDRENNIKNYIYIALLSGMFLFCLTLIPGSNISESHFVIKSTKLNVITNEKNETDIIEIKDNEIIDEEGEEDEGEGGENKEKERIRREIEKLKEELGEIEEEEEDKEEEEEEKFREEDDENEILDPEFYKNYNFTNYDYFSLLPPDYKHPDYYDRLNLQKINEIRLVPSEYRNRFFPDHLKLLGGVLKRDLTSKPLYWNQYLYMKAKKIAKDIYIEYKGYLSASPQDKSKYTFRGKVDGQFAPIHKYGDDILVGIGKNFDEVLLDWVCAIGYMNPDKCIFDKDMVGTTREVFFGEFSDIGFENKTITIDDEKHFIFVLCFSNDEEKNNVQTTPFASISHSFNYNKTEINISTAMHDTVEDINLKVINRKTTSSFHLQRLYATDGKPGKLLQRSYFYYENESRYTSCLRYYIEATDKITGEIKRFPEVGSLFTTYFKYGDGAPCGQIYSDNKDVISYI